MNHGASRSLALEETPTWCFYLGLALAVRQARWSLAPEAGQTIKHPDLAHLSKNSYLKANQTCSMISQRC